MPTYVYKFVKTGETIEIQQGFHEAALTTAVHPRSGRKMAVKKVFTPVGVTFRGDGFYKTDSRSTSSTTKSTTDGDSKSKDSSSDGSADSSSTSGAKGDSPKADTKSVSALKASP